MNSVNRKRLFIGIAYRANEKVAGLLRELNRLAASSMPGLRPVAPDNLHVTLKFLGNVPDSDLALICQALKQCVAGLPYLELQISSIGFFPQSLWLAVKPDHRMADLVRQLNGTLAAIGFPPENRPYVPHLTVARLRSGSGINSSELGRKYAEKEWGRLQAKSVTLFESITLSAGVRYKALYSVALSGQ